MPPFSQWLFTIGLTTVTVLAQLGSEGANFMQGNSSIHQRSVSLLRLPNPPWLKSAGRSGPFSVYLHMYFRLLYYKSYIPQFQPTFCSFGQRFLNIICCTHSSFFRFVKSSEKVNVPRSLIGGFYAVARVGRVPPKSACCPRVRMFFAALVSLSNSHPHSHECQRSERSFFTSVPHPEHICDVL
jgi:hypothetical protein